MVQRGHAFAIVDEVDSILIDEARTPLIISGPSGVGKSTITNEVLSELDAVLSISMTTRPPAKTDVEGEHYYFVDEKTFRAAIDRGELLEWAEVFGNLYGTPRGPVEKRLAEGRIVILEIDIKGAEQVKAKMPDAYAIFIEAPSEQVLLHRLRTRKREDERTIQRRFAAAKQEIDQAHHGGVYHAFLVNDNLDRAVTEAVALIRSEQKRRSG